MLLNDCVPDQATSYCNVGSTSVILPALVSGQAGHVRDNMSRSPFASETQVTGSNNRNKMISFETQDVSS